VEAAGGAMGTLTLTLMWSASMDLDIYFTCHDDVTIYYSNQGPASECVASLGIDMVASE